MNKKETQKTIPRPSSSAQLINFLAVTTEHDLSSHLFTRAKDLLIDHLGVAYCGLHLPWSKMICARAVADGGPPESTIYGHGRVGARNASLANATMAHALELDDTHIPSLSHMSAVIFPAALAIAESRHASGKEFLTAYILGAEAMGRIGRAAGQSLINGAFHPTSTSGVFGAAAAAAKLLKLEAHGIEAAFGLAASMASGVMQFSLESEGTMVKRLHAGLPAHHGVLAALLAADGFSGPSGAIDGERGFLKAFARHTNSASIAQDLGGVFMIEDVSFKLNACCLHFATLIDSLNECRAACDFPVDQIEAIQVHGPKALLSGHMEYRPKSMMAAQYSLPFVTAVTLLLDPRSPISYNEQAMNSPEVLAMADRVTAFEDADLEKLFPARFPARTKVIYKGGKVLESHTLDPLGSSVRPLQRPDIIAKFRALNQDILPLSFQNDLLAAIDEIEVKDGLKRLSDLLNVKQVPAPPVT